MSDTYDILRALRSMASVLANDSRGRRHRVLAPGPKPKIRGPAERYQMGVNPLGRQFHCYR